MQILCWNAEPFNRAYLRDLMSVRILVEVFVLIRAFLLYKRNIAQRLSTRTQLYSLSPHLIIISSLLCFLDFHFLGCLCCLVLQIPGIGPAAAKHLADQGISTSFQLIGKFLMLKEEGVECVDHCDRFWLWLKAIGINAHRGSVVNSIAER